MPSNHLILCYLLLILPSVFPSIRVFSNESVLCIRWPKYWSFSYSISPSNEYSGLISFRKKKIEGNWLVWSPCSPRDSQESFPTTQFQNIDLWYSAFLLVQLSHPYMTTGKTIALTIWNFVDKVMSLLFFFFLKKKRKKTLIFSIQIVGGLLLGFFLFFSNFILFLNFT